MPSFIASARVSWKELMDWQSQICRFIFSSYQLCSFFLRRGKFAFNRIGTHINGN